MLCDACCTVWRLFRRLGVVQCCFARRGGSLLPLLVCVCVHGCVWVPTHWPCPLPVCVSSELVLGQGVPVQLRGAAQWWILLAEGVVIMQYKVHL